VHKVGDKLETEQGVSGGVSVNGHLQIMKITIFTRWKNGVHTIESRYEYRQLTNDRLKQMGVPDVKLPS
jgi:hypothetical protein